MIGELRAAAEVEQLAGAESGIAGVSELAAVLKDVGDDVLLNHAAAEEDISIGAHDSATGSAQNARVPIHQAAEIVRATGGLQRAVQSENRVGRKRGIGAQSERLARGQIYGLRPGVAAHH